MARCLLTGGAGFIGSNLAEALVKEGYEVIIVDNFSTGKRENISSLLNYLELKEGDIRDKDFVEKVTKGVDFILHQAAIPSVIRSLKEPDYITQVNLIGTLNLLLMALKNKVKLFLHASSSSVYGESDVLPKHEEMPTNPLSFYGLSKLAAENYCKLFHSIHNLKTIILRYFNVFGKNQDANSPYAAVIPKFIGALLENKKVVIYGDGEQTRDFTHIDNVVAANLAVLKNYEAIRGGEVFNIAAGEPNSVNKLFNTLKELLNVEVKEEHAPPRIGDIRHSWADITKAKKTFGYTPKVTFKEGLKLTINYFKNKITRG